LPLFSGEYPSSRDDKNRIIIPAKMRQAAGRQGEAGYYVTRGVDDCIVIQTLERFEQAAAARADSGTRQVGSGRKLERAIFSKAEYVKCDRQGRLLLPARLTEALNIGKNVVIVGVNDRIEVWDADRWKQVDEEAQRELEEHAEEFYGRSGDV
jgi:MraZ protein